MVKDMKNKEKYDLNTLKVKWIPQTSEIIVKLKSDNSIIFSKEMTPIETITNAYNVWLEQEYKPKILDEKEKEYLSAVIKPFRKEIECIEKVRSYYGENEYIHIAMKKDDDYCELPWFSKGTIYKGMEVGKVYTLEELGL
jgi:hypothetical protein|nr:MAG TPA: hypothetical protein [Bacteriophage sp.]